MRRLLGGRNSSGSVRAAGGRRRRKPLVAGGHCCLIYHQPRRPSVRPRSPNVIVMSSFIRLEDERAGRRRDLPMTDDNTWLMPGRTLDDVINERHTSG